MLGGALQLDEIVPGLACRRVGTQIELLDSVSSTNDVAWQRIDSGAPDGLVILAEHQSSGRGRLGRSWRSPRGASVLCSVVVFDEADLFQGGLLGLVCAAAACDAVRASAGVPAELRWPNDLVIGERKVGGVLVEARAGTAGGRIFVAGIGINCLQHRAHFPPELRSTATSLDLESPHPIHRAAICRSLLEELDGWLAHADPCTPEQIRLAWRERAMGWGQPIRLRHGGRDYCGTTLDVDPTSALIVHLDDGRRMLFPADSTTVLVPPA